MTVTFKDPVAVPHRYRNRFLRDGGAVGITNKDTSSAGSTQVVDLSPYLTKSNAEAVYIPKSVFDALFEKVTISGTEYLRTKLTVLSSGDVVAYGNEAASATFGYEISGTGNAITNAYISNGKLYLEKGTISGGGSGSGSTVSWGAQQTGYVPLTVNGTSKNLSLNDHTHNYSPVLSGNVTSHSHEYVNGYKIVVCTSATLPSSRSNDTIYIVTD